MHERGVFISAQPDPRAQQETGGRARMGYQLNKHCASARVRVYDRFATTNKHELLRMTQLN